MTRKLNYILKNENTKTLAENFVSLSLLKVIGFVIQLITLPYLARVIGAEGFGAIAFAGSIMVFVETITDWGFNYTATRDVAVARSNNDSATLSRIFSEVMGAKICLTALCFVLLCVAIFVIPGLHDYRILLLLTFLYIPGHIMFPEWIFQAFEQMKYITILNVISKLLFTALVFVVIRQKSDYIYQPLLTACGYIFSGILALRVIYTRFHIRFVRPSFRDMFSRMRESTDMFISLIMPNFYSNFSTIILKTYCGDIATGIYDAGRKFLAIMDQISQILSRVFFPHLARNTNRHKTYVAVSGTVCLLSCLLMFFGAKLFVHAFYTPEFESAITVTKIFAFGPIGLFLMNTYGVNYLVLIKKENILRNIIIVSSVFGFVLSWIITRQFGYIGAATTLITVWLVRGIITYVMANKEKRKLN